jgi:leader peptidase (prepilin peptidase)/N-methyltransferase
MTLTELAADLGTGRQRAAAAAAVPAVEAILVWRIGWSAALAAFMYLGALGVTVSVIDLHTHRLPNRIVLPSYPVVVALLALAAGMEGRLWPLGRATLAMALVTGFYLVLGLSFPHGLGLGDAKLGGLLALGLGWLGWPTLTTGVLVGWALAALALLARHATRPAARGRPIALGPWLCLGALVAIGLR